RVVDLSSGIRGGYCTKILADGGAEVVKVESPDGDPLRAWAIGAVPPPGQDGALFQLLACSKQSVLIDPDRESDRDRLDALLAGADIIVWSSGTQLSGRDWFHPLELRR